MKALYWIIGLIIIAALAWLAWGAYQSPPTTMQTPEENAPVTITPIEHATLVMDWGGTIIYVDPTDATKLAGQPAPSIILVTDIHGDHFSTSTLEALGSSTLIVPQTVYDQLPSALASSSQVLANGESASVQGLSITAVPMYNLPESEDSRHTKGRGNGYIIEKDGYRVYVAGDTAGTPEMRALTNIDVAFVPMNLPYTMSVEEAADAVLAFVPKIVYPYHYRGTDGLADVGHFKELVNQGNQNISVMLADWYPAQ